MEEKVKKACPDALVFRRGDKYHVLLPEKFDASKVERIFLEDGKEVEIGQRQKCEVWTRIVGYLRPKGPDHWNAGKLSEYADRKMFVVPNDKRLSAM